MPELKLKIPKDFHFESFDIKEVGEGQIVINTDPIEYILEHNNIELEDGRIDDDAQMEIVIKTYLKHISNNGKYNIVMEKLLSHREATSIHGSVNVMMPATNQ